MGRLRCKKEKQMAKKKYRVVTKKKNQSDIPIKNCSVKDEYIKAFENLLPELEDVREEIFKIINEFLKNYYDEQKMSMM